MDEKHRRICDIPCMSGDGVDINVQAVRVIDVRYGLSVFAYWMEHEYRELTFYMVIDR
jgi:hypothetical protein